MRWTLAALCMLCGCDSLLGLHELQPIDGATVYRRPITITQDGTTTLTQVPVSIVIANDSGLAAHAAADGSDLVFGDGSGNELPAEIVQYGSGSLEAWVAVPTLAPGTTTIILAYGGGLGRTRMPSETWSNSFVGAWHLSGDGATASDSTMHHHDIAAGTNPPISTDGIAGSALRFGAIAGEQLCGADGDGTMEFGTGSFTYEVWLDLTVPSGTLRVALEKGGTSPGSAGFDLETSTEWIANVGDTVTSVENDATLEVTGRWVYMTLVVDRIHQQLQAYVDGVFTGSSDLSAIGAVDSAEPLCLGGEHDFTYPFRGVLDEARLANVARTADWIRFAHENLTERSQVVAFGPEP